VAVGAFALAEIVAGEAAALGEGTDASACAADWADGADADADEAAATLAGEAAWLDDPSPWPTQRDKAKPSTMTSAITPTAKIMNFGSSLPPRSAAGEDDDAEAARRDCAFDRV